MPRRAPTFLAFLALLCLFFSAFAPAARADGADNYKALFSPKTVWLNTTRPLTQKDAEGRMVLLDFWTYGCINCMQVVPDLKALEKQFGDRLLIIGVHSAKFVGERGSRRIEAAAKRFGLTHPVINDADFRVWKAFGAQAWPTLALLDGTGKRVALYAGEGHRADLARDIAAGLKTMAPEKGETPLSALEPKDKDTSVLSFPARLGYAKGTPYGDLLFIVDSGHNRILGATLSGKVKLVIGSGKPGQADGSFKTASFYQPRGLAVTQKGLYIADTGNHLIRFADFAKKTVTRVAGTGKQGYARRAQGAPALSTPLASPWDVKMMPRTYGDGHVLAIAMAGLHQIWRLDTQTGKISAAVGTGAEDIVDGPADEAALAQPSGLSVADGTLYFVDAESSALRELTPGGRVKTLIGTGLFDFGRVDGIYPRARLQHAQGLAATKGRIYIADTYNNALRAYDTKTGQLSTLKLPKGALSEPGDVLPLAGKLYVADTNDNAVRIVDPQAGTVKTLRLSLSRP